MVCSLSLSQIHWEIKRIDLAYQNSTIFTGISQCLGLSTASGVFVS